MNEKMGRIWKIHENPKMVGFSIKIGDLFIQVSEWDLLGGWGCEKNLGHVHILRENYKSNGFAAQMERHFFNSEETDCHTMT